VTSARILLVAFCITRIASRALDAPVQEAFIVAQDGIGTGLAGGLGVAATLGVGEGLGVGVGVGLASSEGVGLVTLAVPLPPPQPASAKRTTTATPSLTGEWNDAWAALVTKSTATQ
jgi:hypothetical protein